MISNLKDFDVTQDEVKKYCCNKPHKIVTNSADTTARSYINGLKKLQIIQKLYLQVVVLELKGENYLVRITKSMLYFGS